jgi:hypothetical protein
MSIGEPQRPEEALRQDERLGAALASPVPSFGRSEPCFDFAGCQPAERGVTAPDLAPELDVVVDRGGETDPAVRVPHIPNDPAQTPSGDRGGGLVAVRPACGG